MERQFGLRNHLRQNEHATTAINTATAIVTAATKTKNNTSIATTGKANSIKMKISGSI